MGKRVAVIVVAAVGLLVCVGPAPARLLESWPYDKLLKRADLVVFATAVKTEAAADEPPEHSWNFELVAQTTTFKVSHALKGEAGGGQLKVLHFKFGELKKGVEPNVLAYIVEDGPLLVAFRTKSVIVKAEGAPEDVVLRTPEYLLFLKRANGGRYEPVSGPIDPALSVKEVSAPLGKVLGDK